MIIHCPLCHKKTTWEENPYRPFCSERCKLTDLGLWAGEEYRIADESADETAEEEGTAGEGENSVDDSDRHGI